MASRTGKALLLVALAVFAFAVLGADRDNESRALPQVAEDARPALRGAAFFVGDGFGGISQTSLETNAIPWKLAAAALVLDEVSRNPGTPATRETLRSVLKRFGFLYPETLEGMPPDWRFSEGDKPLGMTHGEIAPVGGARVEVANLGCAACHASVAYDAAGNPDPTRAVPGMPNTSLDLESYTQAVFFAMRDQADDSALLDMADRLFPQMDWRERASLRWLVLPLARSRLEELEGRDRAIAFPNGLPGATNGVAALKLQTASPLLEGGSGDRGFVSVPELGLRHWRSRLLADGAYATPSGTNDPRELAAIASFFTVPSMGVKPEDARRHIPKAEAIFAWLADYRPARYPGPVDETRVIRGAGIYARDCAACHGSYVFAQGVPQLESFPDWIGDVGTDPLRAQVFDASLVQAVRHSRYGDTFDVRTGEGYAAPPLAGLWASAPYLHNGSVPTLAALLDPGTRPARFMVGGHALDWARVGLRLERDGRYPAGYTPFSTPQWVDTSQPGLGNGGHTYGSDLPDAEKADLIEFLKAL